MGQGNFTEDFRLDAIKLITERGHSVADVSKRLGVSMHSSISDFYARHRRCFVSFS
jgi:transposase